MTWQSTKIHINSNLFCDPWVRNKFPTHPRRDLLGLSRWEIPIMLWALSSEQGDGCMLLKQQLCSWEALSSLLGDFPMKWGEDQRLQLPVNGSQRQVPVSCGPSRSHRWGESEAARLLAPMAGPLSSPGGERTPSPEVSQVWRTCWQWSQPSFPWVSTVQSRNCQWSSTDGKVYFEILRISHSSRISKISDS